MTVFTKRRLATAAAFAVGVTAGVPLAWGFQPTDMFELEGDATAEATAPGPDDWANVLNQSGPPFTSLADPAEAKLVAVTKTEPCPVAQIGVTCIPEVVNGFPGLIGDPATGSVDQIFTGGGSKDGLDILTGPWLWKFASPSPDKDNILHAAAAAYTLGSNFPACPLGTENTGCKGDLVIVFMLDRLTNNGEADTGFWFLQNSIATIGGVKKGGGFTFNTLGHTTNDILVQIDYPQASGAIPNARVVVWDPTVAGNLRVIAGGTTGTPALCDGSDQLFCAIANNFPHPAGANISTFGTSPSPWPFASKSAIPDPSFCTGAQGCFGAQEFFEGAINLSRAFRVLGQPLPCLSGFVAETRSSAAFDSSLQDFALGGFQLCGMHVDKSCSFQSVSADQSSVTWGFTGTLMNTGVGTVYNIVVADNAPMATSQGTITFNPPLGTNGSLGAGASTVYTGTYTTGAISSTSDTVHVTANSTNGGTAIPPADSSPVTTCSFTPTSGIHVTKTCGPTTLEVVSGTVNNVSQAVVTVSQRINGSVCNTTCIDPNFSTACSNNINHVPPGNGGTGTILNMVKVHDDTDAMGQLTGDNFTLLVNGLPVTTLYPMDSNAGPNCAGYRGSYVPTATDLLNGLPNADPKTAMFTDMVTATGTPTFGLSAVTDQATATCPLCQ